MQKLIGLGNWMAVSFFYLVCIVVLKNMISEAYLSAVILFPVLYVVGYLHRNYKGTDAASFCDGFIIKYRVPMWCCLQVFSVIVMCIMVISLRVNFSWDWGKLLSTAMTKIITGEWVSFEYYYQCSNNQPWLLCLTVYFKIVSMAIPSATEETFHVASILLSLGFTQIALLFVYQTARLLFSEKKAFLVGAIGLACLPFYLYAQFAYTDTISMMLVIISVYIYLKIKRGGVKSKKCRLLLGLLLVLLSVFIFNIKILSFIVVIAMLLDTVLVCKDYKKLLLTGIICFVFWGAGNKIVTVYIDTKLPITEEMADQYEFSWTHYVMMGMNHFGGYLQDDVDFSRNAGNYREKQEAELQELKRRISDYGVKGTLNHLFYTKLSRTWGNSCLAGDDYCHRYPYCEGSVWQRIFGAGEDLHWIVLIYTWSFHILMLFGIFIEAIYSLTEDVDNQIFMALRYTILGVGVFLTLWECNSRYLLPFLPVMILLSCRGWEMAEKLIRKAYRKERRHMFCRNDADRFRI